LDLSQLCQLVEDHAEELFLTVPIQELNKESASVIAKWEGEALLFPQVKKVTVKGARAISKWSGQWMSFESLLSISTESLKPLLRWGGDVDFYVLEDVSATSRKLLQDYDKADIWTGEDLLDRKRKRLIRSGFLGQRLRQGDVVLSFTRRNPKFFLGKIIKKTPHRVRLEYYEGAERCSLTVPYYRVLKLPPELCDLFKNK